MVRMRQRRRASLSVAATTSLLLSSMILSVSRVCAGGSGGL